MIQRIQSIWLLLAGILGFVSFFSGHRINDATKTMVFVNGSYNLLLTVATTIAASVALIAIFLYKNRKLQLQLTIASILLSILTIILYLWQKQSFITEESGYSLTSLISIFIPIVSLLAARGIWKDERLVKSADRLR